MADNINPCKICSHIDSVTLILNAKIDCNGCRLSPYFKSEEELEFGRRILGLYTREKLLKKFEKMENMYSSHTDLLPEIIRGWIVYKASLIHENPNYLVDTISRKLSDLIEDVKFGLPKNTKFLSTEMVVLKSHLAELTACLSKGCTDEGNTSAGIESRTTTLKENVSTVKEVGMNERINLSVNSAIDGAMHGVFSLLRDFVAEKISSTRPKAADVKDDVAAGLPMDGDTVYDSIDAATSSHSKVPNVKDDVAAGLPTDGNLVYDTMAAATSSQGRSVEGSHMKVKITQSGLTSKVPTNGAHVDVAVGLPTEASRCGSAKGEVKCGSGTRSGRKFKVPNKGAHLKVDVAAGLPTDGKIVSDSMTAATSSRCRSADVEEKLGLNSPMPVSRSDLKGKSVANAARNVSVQTSAVVRSTAGGGSRVAERKQPQWAVPNPGPSIEVMCQGIRGTLGQGSFQIVCLCPLCPPGKLYTYPEFEIHAKCRNKRWRDSITVVNTGKPLRYYCKDFA